MPKPCVGYADKMMLKPADPYGGITIEEQKPYEEPKPSDGVSISSTLTNDSVTTIALSVRGANKEGQGFLELAGLKREKDARLAALRRCMKVEGIHY